MLSSRLGTGLRPSTHILPPLAIALAPSSGYGSAVRPSGMLVQIQSNWWAYLRTFGPPIVDDSANSNLRARGGNLALAIGLLAASANPPIVVQALVAIA